MRRLLEDDTSQADRILDAARHSDSARFHGAAIHDRRIELHGSISRVARAFAGIEQRRVLHDVDRRFNRFDRRTAGSQHLVPRFQCVAQPVAIGFLESRFGGEFGAIAHAATAVDDQREFRRRTASRPRRESLSPRCLHR